MNTPVPIIFTVFPRDDGSLNRRLVAALRIPLAFQIAPPTPTDSSIRIEERPGMTVYVLYVTVMNTPVPIIFTVFPRDDGSLNRRLVAALRIPLAFQIAPPTPTDSSIRIEERPGMTVYSYNYKAYQNTADRHAANHTSRLTCTLGDSAPFQRKQYLCCIYDPPIKPYGRRNEVWFLQDEP
uniref:Heme-binding protein 1 n=1 Tax=Cyprinus carpio TaxID=7962 RepID=A0A8C1VIS8_CYPCA